MFYSGVAAPLSVALQHTIFKQKTECVHHARRLGECHKEQCSHLTMQQTQERDGIKLLWEVAGKTWLAGRTQNAGTQRRRVCLKATLVCLFICLMLVMTYPILHRKGTSLDRKIVDFKKLCFNLQVFKYSIQSDNKVFKILDPLAPKWSIKCKSPGNRNGNRPGSKWHSTWSFIYNCLHSPTFLLFKTLKPIEDCDSPRCLYVLQPCAVSICFIAFLLSPPVHLTQMPVTHWTQMADIKTLTTTYFIMSCLRTRNRSL